MRGLLSSPRRRRRLVWLALLVAVASTITILGVFYPNTSPTRHAAPFTKERVQTVAALPQSVPFSSQDRKEVDAVAGRFIATAVFRQHLDQSYDLVVPSFHQGLTRRQWKTGNIPVPPFPHEALLLMRWKLEYSYANRVGMKVAFLPKPKAKVGGIVYAIELTKVGAPAHRHWLVSYWTPSGGEVLTNAQRAAAAGAPAQTKAKLGAGWIFAPIGGLLALIVFVPAMLALRGWLSRRRVEQAYRSLSS